MLRYNLWASQVVLVVKNMPVNAGDIKDTGLILELERSPGGRNGNPVQYSCLENPTDRGAWQATVLRVAKSRTQLKQLSTHAGTILIILPSAHCPRSVFIFHTEWSLPFADSTAWLELPGRVILFVGNCCSLITNIC